MYIIFKDNEVYQTDSLTDQDYIEANLGNLDIVNTFGPQPVQWLKEDWHGINRFQPSPVPVTKEDAQYTVHVFFRPDRHFLDKESTDEYIGSLTFGTGYQVSSPVGHDVSEWIPY